MGAMVIGTLRFGVLGPLEVLRDGRPLPLGGERQRALLAFLLLHANELVATEQLTDQLFTGQSWEAKVNRLYVAVSRLRRLLGGVDGQDVLVTRPGGYLLATEPGGLDVDRFENLFAESRRLRAGGDSEAAAARLREGLALWRGPPFADVASLEFVQSEIRRLDDLRLVAVMERVDADLALGRDRELTAELEMLVASNPLQERLRRQLMIALYRADRQTEALGVYRQTSELLRGELGLEPSRALQELEHAILTHDASLEPAAQEAVREEPAVCPFKGLASFDRSDADYFCGRERIVSELIARLASSAFVGIVGASGIGKSSLLKAGALAALADGALPGSGSWRQVILRPGDHPAEALARALDGAGVANVPAGVRTGERLVIAVDQLEELFTVCEDEDERAGFLHAVETAAHDSAGRALVVVALRADFYGRIADYPGFADMLSRSHVLVGPMDRDELVRVIEEPAARAGLEVERALVDALVQGIDGEPGGLPLLSTALLELWRERDGRTLRYERYRNSGGVQGAVARLAEDAYARLSDRDRRVARTLLLRLASGEDGALVRRRVPIAELELIDGAATVLGALTDARLLTAREGEVEVSHEALIREWPRYRAWLDEDRVGRRVQQHLGASAREWEVRRRETGDLYRGARLAAALDWASQHGDELSATERQFLAASRRRSEREARRLRAILIAVGALLALSVVAGIVALGQQRAARNEARLALARQLGAQAVSEPRIDVAMLLAREAVNLDHSTQTESALLATLLRSPAAIGTIALPTNTTAALAFSPDSHTLAATDRLGELRLFNTRTHALVAPVLTDALANQTPAYSSDGTLLAYRSTGHFPSGGIVVRDAHRLREVANLRFPSALGRFVPSEIPAGSIAIAPDDRTVYYVFWIPDYAAGVAAYVERWSLPSGQALPPTEIGSDALIAMRPIDGGSRLVIVSTRNVEVFDTGSMRRLSAVKIAPAPVAPGAAAISPNGRLAVIGSGRGLVSFVDTSTGETRAGSVGPLAAVASVLYAADGRTVVSIGNDGTAIVWNARVARPSQILPGPPGHVAGAAISPSGNTLYTSSLGGALVEWDLSGQRRFGHHTVLGSRLPCCDSVSPPAAPLAVSPDGSRFAVRLGPSTVGLISSRTLTELSSFTIRPDGSSVTALAWSPGGDELAVGGHSGFVQLWSTRGPPRLRRSLVGLSSQFGLPDAIQSVAFSPDGRLIAASDDSMTDEVRGRAPVGEFATAAIWEVATGHFLVSLGGLNNPSSTIVGRPFVDDVLAFSPDSKMLAVSTFYSTILVFAAPSGRLVRTIASRSDTTALAFAPGGTLASGTATGTVERWDTMTGRQVGSSLVVAASPVTTVAFDRTGQRYVTAGLGEGGVRLWVTAAPAQPGQILNTDQATTSTAAFEPAGNALVAVDDHGNGFTWPMSLPAWERQACAVAGRDLTRQEWSQLASGQAYAAVCP